MNNRTPQEVKDDEIKSNEWLEEFMTNFSSDPNEDIKLKEKEDIDQNILSQLLTNKTKKSKKP